MELRQTAAGPQMDGVDNGPRIAADERAAVLQRFYRGERTRHPAGSGLGLSIVSAVMRTNFVAAAPGESLKSTIHG